MALTSAFNEAVSSGNVRRVRIMMKDSLLNDLSFAQFKEMNNAARGMQGLYDEHDGRNFNMNESTWDDNYMNELMVQVVGNFSHERVDHLKNVIRHLRPVPVKPQQVPSSRPRGSSGTGSSASCSSTQQRRSNYQEQKYRDQKAGNYRGAKIATGVVAGAVVGGAAASLAGFTVVGGAVAGAVVGGVVVSISTNGGH